MYSCYQGPVGIDGEPLESEWKNFPGFSSLCVCFSRNPTRRFIFMSRKVMDIGSWLGSEAVWHFLAFKQDSEFPQPPKWCTDSKKSVIWYSKVSVHWVGFFWSKRDVKHLCTSTESSWIQNFCSKQFILWISSVNTEQGRIGATISVRQKKGVDEPELLWTRFWPASPLFERLLVFSMVFGLVFRWLQDVSILRNLSSLDFIQLVPSSSLRRWMTVLISVLKGVDQIVGVNLNHPICCCAQCGSKRESLEIWLSDNCEDFREIQVIRYAKYVGTIIGFDGYIHRLMVPRKIHLASPNLF